LHLVRRRLRRRFAFNFWRWLGLARPGFSGFGFAGFGFSRLRFRGLRIDRLRLGRLAISLRILRVALRLRFFTARAALDQIAFLVPILLEIRLVPTAARQAERGCRQLAAQLLGSTFRADGRVGVGQFLQTIELMSAVAAFKTVDGHGARERMMGWVELGLLRRDFKPSFVIAREGSVLPSMLLLRAQPLMRAWPPLLDHRVVVARRILLLGNIATMLGSEASLSGNMMAMLGSKAPLPGNIIAMLGSKAPLPGNIIAMLGSKAPLPGNIAALLGSTTSLSGNIGATPGSKARLPGNSAATLGSNVLSLGNIATALGNETTSLGSTVPMLRKNLHRWAHLGPRHQAFCASALLAQPVAPGLRGSTNAATSLRQLPFSHTTPAIPSPARHARA
jgi:hypothetical protein